MPRYQHELSVATQAVIAASTLCQAVQKTMLVSDGMVMTKTTDRTPVTIADYGSQALICRALQEHFPNDPVVGEEDASDLRRLTADEHATNLNRIAEFVNQSLSREKHDANKKETFSDAVASCETILQWIDNGNGKVNPNRYWTLDPIDGTKGFVRGDQYAICLALIEDGHVKVGVLACPALEMNKSIGHIFTAVRGQGAFRQSLNAAKKDDSKSTAERIMVSGNTKTMIQSFEASHGNHKAQQEAAAALGLNRFIGMDSQAKYAMVACGYADLYLRLSSHHENIWDHAAGSILVEEAGGQVTDRHGAALAWDAAKMSKTSGVVVSNGAVHSSVLKVLSAASE